jgi:hypothetical protein
MILSHRTAFAFLLSCVVAETAFAQPAPAAPPAPTTPPAPTAPAMPADGNGSGYTAPWAPSTGAPPTADQPAPEEDKKKPKEPKRGDFDAGGQVRLPSGPDEMGEFGSFNWIALDLKGRYFLLDSITANGLIPLAVKSPDTVGPGGPEPKMIGGMVVHLDAKVPVPKMPMIKYETEMGLSLTAAYMREGAMLLSEKDYPLFIGDFKPGLAGGLIMKIKLSSIVDFSLLPTFAFQSGTTENITAVQVPLALILKVGNAVKLSADAGVFTGDDISLRAKNGGRIYLGAALDVKIGRIITHLGAGFASLITDEMGAYPTIGDSLYLDLNVKFAK